MKLYVGNLPFKATQDALQQHFSQFGTVSEVFIATDRETGRSRGFAFVTMADDAQAKVAIEQSNGKPFDGRNLTVNEARPPAAGGGGGGRGGYGGGGGGGRGGYGGGGGGGGRGGYGGGRGDRY
jgi:RNA recognition motif-containing protein